MDLQTTSAAAGFAPHTLPNPASVLTCSKPTLDKLPVPSTKRTSVVDKAPTKKNNATNNANAFAMLGRVEATGENTLH